jgi:aspartate aminotransferase-like enzyme
MLKQEFPEVLFLVDGITALGAMPLPMTAWGIDGLVGGSQKAFMLPTGLSFVGLSARAFKVAQKNPTPRFYFDLVREAHANQKGESLFSSNVVLIRALDIVLQQIETMTLEHLFKIIHSRAKLTRELAGPLGVTLYSNSPSDSVTAYLLPAGIDSAKIRSELESEHHITIMGGQDEAKGRILRIGHMGYITHEHLIFLFKKLRDVFTQFGVKTNLSDEAINARVKAEVLT